MRKGFVCLASLACLMLLLSPYYLGVGRPGTAGVVTALSGTANPTGFNASQILHAYGFDQLSCFGGSISKDYCGSRQTIAIIDEGNNPNLDSDLSTFNTQFNLPSCTIAQGCLTILTPDGPVANDASDAPEISGDVEWAHAIAPGAHIALFEIPDISVVDLLPAIDAAAAYPGVHQVSMSLGINEISVEDGGYNIPALDTHFQVLGVSFFASSGDDGWSSGTSCAQSITCGEDIEWPAVSPYVVGVGGTTLTLAQGNYQQEVVWTDTSTGGASSGGKSLYEAEPSYQIEGGWVKTNTPPINTATRGVPDVSYAATNMPVYDSYQTGSSGGWLSPSGTSMGTPQWAALWAIANGLRVAAGSSPLSGYSRANGALYAAANSGYSLYYNDITIGSNSNGNKVCAQMCQAQTHYDYITGLGSPRANNLVPYLVALPTFPSVTFNPTPQLPPNTSWSVLIDGNTKYTGSTSQIVVPSVTQFSITYSIPTISCGGGCQFPSSPSYGAVIPALQTTVNVSRQYYLTVSEVNTGLGVCGALYPASGWQNAGSTKLTANWAYGCIWQGWVGSGPGSYTGKGTVTTYTANDTLTLSAPITETGTFYCKSSCAN
ncbi:MAG: S53 family peptidase [Nitrososphaerales archaeon]|jgi:hypothetical protein